jgi:O-antigen ligase
MDLKLLLTAVWSAAGAVLYLLKPAVAPFFLPLALVAPLLWSQKDASLRARILQLSALSGILVLTSGYLMINATWSLDPERAFIAVIIFLVLSLVLHILPRTLPELPHNALRAMALGFYGGYVIGAFLLAIEIIFDHPLHLRLFRAVPTLTPQMRDLVIQDNAIQQLPSYFLNSHVAALAFLIWPALLVAWHLGSSAGTRAILLACLLPTIPAVYLSDHETSKLALTGGVGAFLIARFVPRATSAVIITAWLIACTAAVPLASLAYDLQLHRAEWLQPSARQRIVIWGVTGEQTAKAVLLGHGIVTARQIGKQQEEHPIYAPGTNFPLSVGPHAHNGYLQVWFDTGALGAMLLLVLGLLVLHNISRLPGHVRPALYAMYATVALLAASSFSLWSRPFLASFGIAGAFTVLAWSFAIARQKGDTTAPMVASVGSAAT